MYVPWYSAEGESARIGLSGESAAVPQPLYFFLVILQGRMVGSASVTDALVFTKITTSGEDSYCWESQSYQEKACETAHLQQETSASFT